MKKLLLHIVIVICMFFVIDRTLGLGLGYLYRISNVTDEYKIGYSNAGTKPQSGYAVRADTDVQIGHSNLYYLTHKSPLR